jgi:hypothetical protein
MLHPRLGKTWSVPDFRAIASLQGLIEQVGKQATYAKVAENFQRIATDLTTCRDLSVLLSPPAR